MIINFKEGELLTTLNYTCSCGDKLHEHARNTYWNTNTDGWVSVNRCLWCECKHFSLENIKRENDK
jgi:hypothetical protein